MRDPALEHHHPFYRFRDSRTRRAPDLRCCVCRCLPGCHAWSHVAEERGYTGRAITCSSAYCKDRGRWVARARAWLARPIGLGPPRFKADDFSDLPSAWFRYGYEVQTPSFPTVALDV